MLNETLVVLRFQDSPDRHRGFLRWQEMPLHQWRLHPWQNLQVSFVIKINSALACLLARKGWLLSLSSILFINNNLILMLLLLFWLGVLSSLLKWQEQLSSDAITFITSRSITDSRSAIRLSPATAPQPSVSRPVMSWPSASAALFPRLSASTFSVKRSSASKVTSRRSSFSSECDWWS